MADVSPFRAWRYARPTNDISRLIAPPYDVIAADERRRLASTSEHNVVRLELPDGAADPSAPDNRYAHAKALWDAWRTDGTLTRDDRPRFYILDQTFEFDGRPLSRRALFAAVRLVPFEDGVILPHERTLPKALGDRYELLQATHANFSPVVGLYTDPGRRVADVIESALEEPVLAHGSTGDGVHATLRAISDPAALTSIADLLRDERIFIADGHHRYTVALAHRDRQREVGGVMSGPEPDSPASDHVMIALIAMDDPDLLVLPTHRVADARTSFDADMFWDGVRRFFDVIPVEPGVAADELLAAQETTAFVVRTRGKTSDVLVRLRSDVDPTRVIDLDRSDHWKRLDVAVLQELLLDPLLDIHPDRPETLERLSFVKDSRRALDAAATHDVVFVMRPTSLEQLRAVSLAGETMPQKSTYFYPKLPSGFVFRQAD